MAVFGVLSSVNWFYDSERRLSFPLTTRHMLVSFADAGGSIEEKDQWKTHKHDERQHPGNGYAWNLTMVLLDSAVSISVAQTQSIEPGSCSAIELLA